MELNELVYDPKGKSNSTLFSLQKGTFTFIAGAIAKTGDMKIDTPVGTMGIRGTAPRVEILDDGTVKFTTLIEEYKKEQPAGARNASRAEVLQTLDLCNATDPSRAQNRIEACKTLVETHVERPQSLALVYNNLGSARVVNGDYDDAIADYSASIRLDPASAKAFNNRGIAYQKKGDNQQALADFSRTLSISPGYVFALANRAKFYELTGDIDRAVLDLGEAIRVQPASGAYWNERCWLRATRRSAQEALNDCNEAIRLGPASAAKFDSRGLAYLKIGNAPLSIADYTSALALEPRSASALYGRGLAKRLAGHAAGAAADISAATAINGGIADQFAQFGLR
jgi:tetratricopeptide (TPR) repeat protein